MFRSLIIRSKIITLFICFQSLTCTLIYSQVGESGNDYLRKNIIGTWQRSSSIVGNGLGQNFVFYEDGTFVLNLGDDRDDLRNVVQIKGRYRIESDRLYFTITEEVIVDGNIVISDSGVSMNIFSYDSQKAQVVKPIQAGEMKDPCYVSVINSETFKLNNVKYFKVK